MLSSFYPVVAGRTSDALSRYRSLYQVQVSKLGIQQVQDQLSTGQRFQLPSEDPTAAIRVMGIQRELEFRDQTLRNLSSSQGYLNVTESSLSNIQDVITQIRGLGVESAGNVDTPEERAGWVSQIDEAIKRLTAEANTTYQDRYLFSGGALNSPTVVQSKNAVQFNGNDNSLLTIANRGEYVAHNVTGQKALGLISDGVVSTANFAPAAIGSTSLADLNGGRGVSPGAIQLTDGVESVTVDLAGAASINDVFERINGRVKLSDRDISLTLANGSLVATYADGNSGILRISDVGAGKTASDLGLATDVPAPTLPIIGANLDAVLRPTTLITQLNNGNGLDTSEGIRIEQGGRTYNVLLGSANTIEDLTNLINHSGASVQADITPDGRSIRVRSTESGTDFSIGENGGSLAERLGLRTFNAQTRLDQLNYGRGVSFVEGPDLAIKRNDGTELQVDLSGSVTIQDVLDRINNHVDNQDATTKITARLNSFGNGITIESPLSDPSALNPTAVGVRVISGSQAGWDLGLVTLGKTETTAVADATGYTLVGTDSNPQEVKGIFNSLYRLRAAVSAGDSTGTSRSVALLDQDLSRLSLARGSLGVQQQQIDDLKSAQEQNKIDLKADESANLDADMATTITDLNARQVAYEASLKLLSSTTKTSLFDYL